MSAPFAKVWVGTSGYSYPEWIEAGIDCAFLQRQRSRLRGNSGLAVHQPRFTRLHRGDHGGQAIHAGSGGQLAALQDGGTHQ